jgi:CheY-like chemotaxis protein
MTKGEKMQNNKSILLVEDDQIDAMTVKRAFKDLNICNPLNVVGNGLEAINYLENEENQKPCILLLDLNMPKMNGIEFLRTAREKGILSKIPVVVLTTSAEDQDRIDGYDLGIAGYMIKPVDYMKFVEIIRTINLYWTISKLPDNA